MYARVCRWGWVVQVGAGPRIIRMNTRVCRWGRDPYALGCYSFMGVGCTAEDVEALGRPLDTGSLFFAGEATHPRHPSTVHGAFMSGILSLSLSPPPLHP